MPAPVPSTHPEPAAQPATDVVRWAAFGCLLVPVVLLAQGDSAGGAATVAFGLTAITVTCRALLRRSARAAAREDSLSAPRSTPRSAPDPALGSGEGAHGSDRTPQVVRR
ncbi:hypothetical protein [Streptomyces sp. BE230]|uniref:hypothetical protein n=1 Tax=Streptomyces sp. BE230 TaxID=3002526 RepID=UPI002ED33EE3|nr:hypothetical protein [Streptomyces sp. BE230]